jgi:phosphatidylglycerol:prolipoprotein diacylglycerol transferase
MTHLHTIDPVALDLGPVAIHWYGLMYLAAFAVAWWLGRRRLAHGRLPVSEAAFGDLMFYGMVGVIAGGRLGWILFYGWHEWLLDPLMLLRVWEGGMSFHGGLLGVLVAGWWWARRNRIAFWDAVDFVAPLVPPGLGLGRIGNYINGELWGKETGGSWGVVFPSGLPEPERSLPLARLAELHAAGQLDAYARHPSQLYQAALEGLVLFVVLWWYSSRPRPRYAVAGLFAIGYGLARFAVEFVRVPDAGIGYLAFGWLTMGQLLTLPLLAVGVALLVASRRSPTVVPVIRDGGSG